MTWRWVVGIGLGVLCSTAAYAADGAAAATPERELESMIYADVNHMDLLTGGNAAYVDLQREIAQEQMLRQQQVQMPVLHGELSARLDELKALQAQLEANRVQVKDKVAEGIGANDNLKLLVTLYESLKAEEAAGLIKHLPPNVALQMLRMMSPRKSSKILSVMEPRLAAEISKRLIREPAETAAAPAKGGAS